MSKIDVVETLAERMDNDGMTFSSVNDGYVITFSADILRALLERAESSNSGKAIVFVQSNNPNKA
jgi:hypothetical protein